MAFEYVFNLNSSPKIRPSKKYELKKMLLNMRDSGIGTNDCEFSRLKIYFLVICESRVLENFVKYSREISKKTFIMY